jgi:hypothetical protein
MSLASVAPTHLMLGDVERARALLRESLQLANAYGYSLLLAHIVPVAAELAARDGEPALAAQLVGASESAFAAIGAPMPEATRRALDRVVGLVGGEVGAELETLVADGRALSVDAALASADRLLVP